MPRAYSSTLLRKHNATGGDEVARVLLEISNPALIAPIRVVNDTLSLVSNGETFVAFAFDVMLPNDSQGQLPKAQLQLDNAGEDLTEWLDLSRGGKDSSVRFMQVLRSAPNNVEWEITLDLTNVQVTWTKVGGELGFENLLSRPAVAVTYNPGTAPGLF